MERLTKTYSDWSHGAADNLPCGENSYQYKELLLETLGKYEDLDEQGLLLRLPCKVGDKLYYTDSYYNAVVPVRLNEVITQFVGINNYAYQYNCCSFDGCGDTYEEYEFDNNDFGKTVFLTESEAEAKLKEMESSHDGE